MIPSMITIHCADSKNGDNRVNAAEIRQWHLARGWKDIGYQYVIKCDGTTEKGRPDDEIGAHVEGHNTGNLGICLPGKDRFTAEQFRSLRILLDTLLEKYPGISKEKIFGHYQFDTAKAQGKTCPNMKIERVLDWYLNSNEIAIEPYLLSV